MKQGNQIPFDSFAIVEGEWTVTKRRSIYIWISLVLICGLVAITVKYGGFRKNDPVRIVGYETNSDTQLPVVPKNLEQLINDLDYYSEGLHPPYSVPFPHSSVDDALDAIPKLGDAALPALMAHLHDPLKWRRLWCIHLLGKMGNSQTDQELIKILSSKDDDEVSWTLDALKERKCKKALPQIDRLMRSKIDAIKMDAESAGDHIRGVRKPRPAYFDRFPIM